MMNNVYYSGMAGSSNGQSMHEEEIEKIINEVKSQGVFDEFRRDCISDVDTKPAYQNLRSRVETSIQKFLEKLKFDSTLNKNIVRENLRKHVLESSFYNPGLDRITDQIVNPKMMPVLYPKVEKIVCDHLNIPYVPSANPVAPASLQPSISYANTNGSLNNHIPSLIPGVAGSTPAEHKDESKPQVKPDVEVKVEANKESEAPPQDQRGVQDMDVDVSPKSEPMDVVSSLSGISDLASHDENSDSNASSSGSVSHQDTGQCTTADTGDDSNSNWEATGRRNKYAKRTEKSPKSTNEPQKGSNEDSQKSTELYDEPEKSNKKAHEGARESQKSDKEFNSGNEDSYSYSGAEDRFNEDSRSSSVDESPCKPVLSSFGPDLLNIIGAVGSDLLKSDDESEKKHQEFAKERNKDDGNTRDGEEKTEKNSGESGDKKEYNDRSEKSIGEGVSDVDEKEDGEVDDEDEDDSKTETLKEPKKEVQEKSGGSENERLAKRIFEEDLERISSSDEDFGSAKSSEKNDSADGNDHPRKRKSYDDKDEKRESKGSEKDDESESNDSSSDDDSRAPSKANRMELKSSDTVSSEEKSRDSMAMEIDEASQESIFSKHSERDVEERSKRDKSSDSKRATSRNSDSKEDTNKKSDTKEDSKGVLKDDLLNDVKDKHESERDGSREKQNRDRDKKSSHRDRSSEKDTISSSKHRSSDGKSSSRSKSDSKSSSRDRHASDRSRSKDDNHASQGSNYANSSERKERRKSKEESSKDRETEEKLSSHSKKDKEMYAKEETNSRDKEEYKSSSSSRDKSSRTKGSSSRDRNEKRSSSSRSESKASSRDSSKNRGLSSASEKDRESDSRKDRSDKHRSSVRESSREGRSDKNRHSKERSSKSDSRYRSDSTKTGNRDSNRQSKRDRVSGDNSESELKSEQSSCRDYDENRSGRSPPKSPEGDKSFGSSRREHSQKSSSAERRDRGSKSEEGGKSNSEKRGRTKQNGGIERTDFTDSMDCEVASYTSVTSFTPPPSSTKSPSKRRDCFTPPSMECVTPKNYTNSAEKEPLTPSKAALKRMLDLCNQRIEQEKTKQNRGAKNADAKSPEGNMETRNHEIKTSMDAENQLSEANIDASNEITEANVDKNIPEMETNMDIRNEEPQVDTKNVDSEANIDTNSDRIETKIGTGNEEMNTANVDCTNEATVTKYVDSCIEDQEINSCTNEATVTKYVDSCIEDQEINSSHGNHTAAVEEINEDGNDLSEYVESLLEHAVGDETEKEENGSDSQVLLGKKERDGQGTNKRLDIESSKHNDHVTEKVDLVDEKSKNFAENKTEGMEEKQSDKNNKELDDKIGSVDKKATEEIHDGAEKGAQNQKHEAKIEKKPSETVKENQETTVPNPSEEKKIEHKTPAGSNKTFLNGKPNIKLTSPNHNTPPAITSVNKTTISKTTPSNVNGKLSNTSSSTKKLDKPQCVKKLVEINMWVKERVDPYKVKKDLCKMNKTLQDKAVEGEHCKKVNTDQTELNNYFLKENTSPKEKGLKTLEKRASPTSKPKEDPRSEDKINSKKELFEGKGDISKLKENAHKTKECYTMSKVKQDTHKTKQDMHKSKEQISSSKQDIISPKKNDSQEDTTFISLHPESLGIQEDELINALQVTVNVTNCCTRIINTNNKTTNTKNNEKTPDRKITRDKNMIDIGNQLQTPKEISNNNKKYNSSEVNETPNESYSKKTATSMKEMLKISRARLEKKQKSIEENKEEINGEKENKRTLKTENTDCRRDVKKEVKQMQENNVYAKIEHYKKLKTSMEKRLSMDPKNITLCTNFEKVKNILEKLALKKRLLMAMKETPQIKGHNNVGDGSVSFEKNKPGDILRNITTMQATVNKEGEQKLVHRLEMFRENHSKRIIENEFKEDKETILTSSTQNDKETTSTSSTEDSSYSDSFDIEEMRKRSVERRKLKLIALEKETSTTDSPKRRLFSENNTCSDESDKDNAFKEKSPKLKKSPVNRNRESRKIAAIKKQLQELKNKKIQMQQSQANVFQSKQEPTNKSPQLTPSKIIVPAHMIPKLQLDPCDQLAQEYAAFYHNRLLQEKKDSGKDDGEISDDDMVLAMKRKIALEIKNKVKSSPPQTETNCNTSPRPQITSSAIDDLIELRKQKNDIITVYNKNHQTSQNNRCETRNVRKNSAQDFDSKTKTSNGKEIVGDALQDKAIVQKETQNDDSTCERLEANSSSRSSSYLNTILDEEDEFIKRYVMPVIESRRKPSVNNENKIVKSTFQVDLSEETIPDTSMGDGTLENTNDETSDHETLEEDCADQKDIKSKVFEQLQRDFLSNQEKYAVSMSVMKSKDDKSRIFEELEKQFYSNPLKYSEKTPKKIKSPKLEGKKKSVEIKDKTKNITNNTDQVVEENKMSLFEKLQQDFYHSQSKNKEDEVAIENDEDIIEINDETTCEELKDLKKDTIVVNEKPCNSNNLKQINLVVHQDKTDNEENTHAVIEGKQKSFCEKENIKTGTTQTRTQIKDLDRTENRKVPKKKDTQGKISMEVTLNIKTREKREISKPIRFHSEDDTKNNKVSPSKKIDFKDSDPSNDKDKNIPKQDIPFSGFKVTEKIAVIKKIHSYTDLVIAIEQFERSIPKNNTSTIKTNVNKRGKKRQNGDMDIPVDNKFEVNKISVAKNNLPNINNKSAVPNTKTLEKDTSPQNMTDDDFTSIKRSRMQRSSEESGYGSTDLNTHEEEDNDHKTSQQNRSAHWSSQRSSLNHKQEKEDLKGLKVPKFIIRRKEGKVEYQGGEHGKSRERENERTRNVNTTEDEHEKYKYGIDGSSYQNPCHASSDAHTSRSSKLVGGQLRDSHVTSEPMRDREGDPYTPESLQSVLDAVNNDINDHVVAAQIKIVPRSTAPPKPRRSATGVQHYDSADLYKPRLSFQSKRRKLSPP